MGIETNLQAFYPLDTETAAVPFPDSGETSPINMTGNEGLWHLENSTADSSGNGNTLTAHNAPSYPPGKVGAYAAEFNGTNQYFDVDLAGDAPTTHGSISCWFKLDSTAALRIIAGLGVTSAAGVGIWRAIAVYNTGMLAFFGYSAASDIRDIVALSTGQWYHVVITWENNDVVVYLDGVSVASQTVTLNTPETTFSIAGRTVDGSYYLDGQVDETAIWSRVLSAAEVANIYAIQRDICIDDWSNKDGVNTYVTHAAGSAVYNGASSYTTMGDVLNFGTSDFSVAGWIYAVSVAGPATTNRVVIKFTWAGANFTGWAVSLYDDTVTDKIMFHLYSGGTGYGPAQTTIPGLSTWFHFAIVRSGTNMILYVNGSAVHTVAAGATPDVTTTTDLMFGAVDYDGTAPPTPGVLDFFDGSLDEVALWDRAITAVEVAAIHTAGRGNFATLLPTAVVPDIAGPVLVPATFDGSASTNPAYYHWSWVSVPGGSTVQTAPIPFPDAQAATPIDMTGNVALYHMEGAGTDSSSRGNNLTAVNVPTYVTGKVGAQAADLNGSNQYFHVDLAGDSPTTVGTMAAWVYFDAFDEADNILGIGPTEFGSWPASQGKWRVVATYPSAYLGAADGWGARLAFFGYGADIHENQVPPTQMPTLYPGQWYHVAFSWDTTDPADQVVVVYLNGAKVGSRVIPELTTTGLATVLSLGASTIAPSPAQYTDCKIDEAAVWARVLSAAEVASIYTAQSFPVPKITGAVPFPDNQAATPIDMTDNEGLWHLDGTDADSSGHGRNGKINQATKVTGKVGAFALEFAAHANYRIEFAAASVFVSADFSIAFWIKADAAWTPSTWKSVLGASNGSSWSEGFGIFWQGATTLRCFVGSYAGTYADITPGDITEWNHIVMTYDGVNITGYLNGVQASQVAYSAALTGLGNAFQVNKLGSETGGAVTIDEVAIWSRAVSGVEVAAMYALQNQGNSEFTFTPDIAGTYTANLAVSDAVPPATVNTDADAIIAAAGGGAAPSFQGDSFQGDDFGGDNFQGD